MSIRYRASTCKGALIMASEDEFNWSSEERRALAEIADTYPALVQGGLFDKDKYFKLSGKTYRIRWTFDGVYISLGYKSQSFF